MKHTVLVVEDHARVRTGVVKIISQASDLEVVAEAANGAEAVEAFTTYDTDEDLSRTPKAGAKAYALKDISSDELITAKATKKSPPPSASLNAPSNPTSTTCSKNSASRVEPRR